ncbi:cytochrome P450 [Streptosporangium sandarakinum]|uniref:cytochrome P450 n=1 Tax=Streptosporangium sandarakinum TaxID=1260955 RepID=UPI00341B3CEC
MTGTRGVRAAVNGPGSGPASGPVNGPVNGPGSGPGSGGPTAGDAAAGAPGGGGPVDDDRRAVERLAVDFDHHDPELTPDLACLVHREIRETTPVAYSRAHGGMWILSRYDDVRAALRDHDTFSSASGVFFPRAEGTPPFAPLEYDPPEHTRFRALMKPPLLLPEARRLAPEIGVLVARAVRPVVARGGGDLVRELAVPLPLAVVSLAVGFSADARDRIRDLTSNTWARMPRDGDAGGFWPAFAELFQSEIRRARARSGGDHLSVLVREEIDGRPVTDAELHVMLVAYAIAGHETSMNTLAHLLRHLAAHPGLQDRLRAEPHLMPAAVEEALRLWTPVDHGTRLTTRDVEVGGVVIPRGSRVVLLTGAANRDPRAFPSPEEFRLDRTPNRHLTFGHGIHFCLGAHLARVEFLAVLRELARHPDYELAGETRRYYENGRHICLDRLPVRFRPDTPARTP